MNKSQAFERLMELREDMDDAIREASDIIRQEFNSEYASANSYWIAHIKSALGDENYPTYSPTMTSTLVNIEEDTYEEEECED
ncbi:MAG: hypothetical protein LC687_03220 [Actinobacteria bacterium]|nr:hypothetical protein [Actinomycetota bacterium]